MFHRVVHLLNQFFQFPIRTRQKVEHPKSKSSQPNYRKRWATLYKDELSFLKSFSLSSIQLMDTVEERSVHELEGESPFLFSQG